MSVMGTFGARATRTIALGVLLGVAFSYTLAAIIPVEEQEPQWTMAVSDQSNHGPAQDPDTPRYSASGHDITPLSDSEVAGLAIDLTAEERRILLDHGTEPPFCGGLLDNKLEGLYLCRLCDLPLFESSTKFTSGTGWPSFFAPYDTDHIRNIEDSSLGMRRIENRCARCDAHLGHVFPDGPKPTGMRFCVNSASLVFVENGEELPRGARPVETETAYFAGGCFWGIEHRMQELEGVVDAVSGYQGGHVELPTYTQICTGTTGHAESVRVRFDPSRIGYETLLEAYFTIHDPTQLNRQGPDIGTQYRSAIFAVNEEQFEQANAFIDRLQSSDTRFRNKKIVTEVKGYETFYEAEEYHQNYHIKHGGFCPLPTFDQ
ncbi:MAG: bifunctional methionine sulfoxide reductase B/A protein [Planctomycetota bacterium]|jgi:peptide methionine sulfoxide reductase msrA/msrB